MSRSALEAAFRATTYRVETPGGVFDLRIDEPNPGFAACLRRQGVLCWGIVTAFNPGGRLADARENEARHEKLRARIGALGLRFYRASNHDDAGDWPVERGFCVLDADEGGLSALMNGFGQVAAVCGETEKEDVRFLWF